MADVFKIKSANNIPYSSDIGFIPNTGTLNYSPISQSYEEPNIDITTIQNKYANKFKFQPPYPSGY